MKPQYLVTVDLTRPETHRAQLTIASRTEALPPLLQFPVWTPGSYLVRDYSRHVTLLEPAEKVSKNEWRLKGKPKSVSYEVYCFEKTVRTSFLDVTHAALVGATLLPLLHAPFEVEFLVPKTWQMSSALKPKRVAPGRFRCVVEHDDDWIDKPLIAWAPGFGGASKFRAGGITHHVAWAGQTPARNTKKLDDAILKLTRATLAMMGGAPFREYWYLLHFGHKLYGGLEHRDSQLSQFDGGALLDGPDWNRFLKLIAHEYFHAWNVKAIRPVALGPFDYFRENYTPDIWFSEGLTDYFDDLIPLRAGLYDESDVAKARLKDIAAFADGHPGHARRSLAESSFDAWIRYYRPDEDSINTDVSYYGKGATLGWCWDAHLQKRSKGRWTLAKLMRAIYKEFGVHADEVLAAAQPGFTRGELLAFAEKTTGIPQKKLVDGWVTARAPLPWRQAARFFGVKWKESVTAPGLEFLGVQNKWEGGRGIVTGVLAGSAGESGGVASGDEILAINGVRVLDADKFKQALKLAMRDGRDVNLLLARADRVLGARVRWKRHYTMGTELSPA
jgi:predicted metalloprotease with PDZ domain